MDEIGKEQFDKADELPEIEPPKAFNPLTGKDIDEEEFNKLLIQMENPVEAQKSLAVQIKSFLDFQIGNEMREKGVLSDHTRRWVESYNSILDRIQKALYGEKNLHLHVGQVTHAHIAAKIRDSQKVKQVDSDS